jgi:hypothetical protein
LASKLVRLHEPAFRTQYAEVKERVFAEGGLLPGTPGSLTLRDKSGYPHWYRRYNAIAGKTREVHVCAVADEDAYRAMSSKIEAARWVEGQVRSLRKLGFQVSDKETARVLVELHNRGLFEAGMVLVGTLAFQCWLNEFGILSVSARTQDVDIARPRALKLASRLSFLELMRETDLPFVPVPMLDKTHPSTSLKLPGAAALRIDLLAPGEPVGSPVIIPELDWAAQSVPYYDYLLADPASAAVLAGWHCIPVKIPTAGRYLMHKLYSASVRNTFPEKAAKDQAQALVLANYLAEHDPGELVDAWHAAPADIRKHAAVRMRLADTQGRLVASLANLVYEFTS